MADMQPGAEPAPVARAAHEPRQGNDTEMLVGSGAGFIKSLFPNFGFIRTDDGIDLFFMPTNVDADTCKYRDLRTSDRVTFEIVKHHRGLRARTVRRVMPQARADA